MGKSRDRPLLLGGHLIYEGPQSTWPPQLDSVREALMRSFQAGDWGRYSGPCCEKLESKLGEVFCRKYVLLCSSGTVAVELALRAVGVKPGKEVILAAYDYPGNFLTVHTIGARPVLVDVAKDNWNMDVSQVEAAIGPDTGAILVSHLHGGVVPMDRLTQVAAKHGVPVVEDIAQIPGGRVQGRLAGTWGEAAALSFGGSKLLTAGRGGAVLTDDRHVYQRLKIATFRYNDPYPLSELQATVLLPQLDYLNELNERRQANVRRLRDALADLPALQIIADLDDLNAPAFYKVGFKLNPWLFGRLSRGWLLAILTTEGLEVGPGFEAAHIGRSTNRYKSPGPLPVSTQAHENLIVLNHSALLDPPDQIDRLAAAIKRVYRFRHELAKMAEKRQ